MINPLLHVWLLSCNPDPHRNRISWNPGTPDPDCTCHLGSSEGDDAPGPDAAVYCRQHVDCRIAWRAGNRIGFWGPCRSVAVYNSSDSVRGTSWSGMIPVSTPVGQSSNRR